MINAFPIIVLDGPDGTGKSTLAKVLVEYFEARYIHLTYRWKTKMFDYHTATIYAALNWSKKSPVIIDRWWPSELCYAKAYRNGTPWPLMGRLLEKPALKHSVVYILCFPKAKDAYLKHYNELKDRRTEMFDEGMEKVYDYFNQLWDQYFSRRFGTYLYDFMKQGHDLPTVVQDIAEIALDYRYTQWKPAFRIDFMNFTGNAAQAEYLLVGDRLKPKTRREVWPWFDYGNSSLWLAEALELSHVPEYEVISMNATLPDGSGNEYMIKEFMDSEYSHNIKVISLGDNAVNFLNKEKINVHAYLRHPQYYRRFKQYTGAEDIRTTFNWLRSQDG